LDNYCVWLVIKKKSITKHGNMNVKLIYYCWLLIIRCLSWQN